jgi:hypothetical protein
MYGWPGRGRFSYLPPWERPGGGWYFRRFRGCWWAPWWFPSSPQEEIKVLKEYREFLNEELKWIEKRIQELEHSEKKKDELNKES